MLGRLVAAGEQEIDGRALADEIDAVAWSVIDAHFGDAFADWRAAAEVSEARPIQPVQYAGSCPLIGEAADPGVDLDDQTKVSTR